MGEKMARILLSRCSMARRVTEADLKFKNAQFVTP